MEPASVDLTGLGGAIVRRRERRGWSTYRLARRAGLGDPYLRRLESGSGGRVGVDVLVRLSHALGTTVDLLLADAGIPISTSLEGEAGEVYAQLDSTTRPAWLRMGWTLRDIQEEYAALQLDEPLRVAEERADYEGQPMSGEEFKRLASHDSSAEDAAQQDTEDTGER